MITQPRRSETSHFSPYKNGRSARHVCVLPGHREYSAPIDISDRRRAALEKLEIDSALLAAVTTFVSFLLERKNNLRADTTLHYLERKLCVNRAVACRLANFIEDVEVGVFIRGRRGSKSRIVWGHAGASGLLDLIQSSAQAYNAI